MMKEKNLRAWFFTNEAMVDFLAALPAQEKVKKIYGIAGGGDFAFNFLSEGDSVEKIILCDIRPIACSTVKDKITLFEKSSFEELDKLFSSKSWRDNLKKKNLWYQDSFLPLTRKDEYLSYLTSKEKFEILKKQLFKIKILEGDFLSQLQSFADETFGLVYVSDIFDHNDYCPFDEANLLVVKNKLAKNGLLLIVTQNQPKKMIKTMEQFGWRLKASEPHRFHLFKAFWQYDYSFLLFEKN